MTSQIKKLLTIMGVFALALVLFTGTALADPVMPSDTVNGENNGSRLSQMIEWMGPENWGQMIQRMNQIHGPEFTGRMIQQMNEAGFCHDGEHPGHGSMMGRGFGNQMGPGFQNSGPNSDDGGQVRPSSPRGMINRGFGR